ncbi:mitochondrial fission protein ELM1-like [Andrographis paniculata]|uniref:mitochondrial fission protein ELM1-like n=1 Tax=Andrographis paniculata TaxID=175694 RepID=UPI0021E864B1|nr:mitochondrial fission protein ELM1-like [Andrographis paniculata]XP_051149610.1 mitochondrial fission protein ELM1-like [Andrographis paniculata]
MLAVRRAIVIGNGCAGAENQCIGLVRALGLSDSYSLYRVRRPRGGINESLHWLPVAFHKGLDRAVKCTSGQLFRRTKLAPLPADGKDVLEANASCIAKMAQETFKRDGPILLVASGRDTISVATSIKSLVPENVFLVQIQHPRSRLRRFDMVITPQHDYYPLTPEAQEQIPFLLRWVAPRNPPDKHVVLTVGALHMADSVALKNAASAWHDVLALLPKPLLVVSIGGPTRRCRYGEDLAMQLTASLKAVLPTCGTLRISFSRRTPKSVADIILKELSCHPKVYIWNGEDPNPHLGHLAWANAFVVTADSVSMLSEACSTGKPVYVIGAERCTSKFAYFLRSLYNRGAIRPFTGEEKISEIWHYSPLCDAKMAADKVIKALAQRGWRLFSQHHHK